MEWRAVQTPQGEIGILEHEGREYSAWGAVITPERATAYCGKDGALTRWDGTAIGRWRIVASWPVQSWIGPTMHQIEAVIDGRTYTGRGLGEGMVWNGKAKKGRR